MITPPNKLFTVFFCEWINKFCQGNLSKSIRFQAPFCSLLITHQFWRHFFYFCYEVSEELGHILLLSSVQWLLIHGVGFTERPWIVRLTFAFLQVEHIEQSKSTQIFMFEVTPIHWTYICKCLFNKDILLWYLHMPFRQQSPKVLLRKCKAVSNWLSLLRLQYDLWQNNI